MSPVCGGAPRGRKRKNGAGIAAPIISIEVHFAWLLDGRVERLALSAADTDSWRNPASLPVPESDEPPRVHASTTCIGPQVVPATSGRGLAAAVAVLTALGWLSLRALRRRREPSGVCTRAWRFPSPPARVRRTRP